LKSRPIYQVRNKEQIMTEMWYQLGKFSHDWHC